MVTSELAAVVDGATTSGDVTYPLGGVELPGGLVAAQLVSEVLAHLPATVSPREAVDQLSAAFRSQWPNAEGPLPAATVAVYNACRREVWRVGDCGVRIDANLHRRVMRVDAVNAEFRAAFLKSFPVAERAEQAARARALIVPLLERQHRFANRSGDLGYGVINGSQVPDEFIEVFDVPSTSAEVVLCSDGYPDWSGTLRAAEDTLADLLRRDPLCVDDLLGTKGVSPGMTSFDDRAWLRLAV